MPANLLRPHLMNRILISALTTVLLVGAAPVRAEVQRNVEQVFPGRVIIGVHPLGVQVNNDASIRYKFAFDIAGLLGHPGRVGVWLGGGFNYAGGPGHDLQPWFFVMLSFERFLHIPLVPTLRLGVGTDVFYGNDGFYDAVSAAFKADFGLHYYLTRHIGIGLQTGITSGPVWKRDNPRDPTTPLRVYGYASWDFGVGARFAF